MLLKEKDLPKELNDFESVEAAYPAELARVNDAITRKLSVLIECEKELVPYFFKCLRDRLKKNKLNCLYLDGRAQEQNSMMSQTIVSVMLSQLREAVRGTTENLIVVLPHLDLLTTSEGGLTTEAKEVIPLCYENPNILWVGFKDPSFMLPRVIESLFPHRESILGIPRDRLQHLILQKEARKFGKNLNVIRLYKYVSGLNSVRLRHVLSSVDGEDYPENSQPAFDQVRKATLCGKLHVPEIDLDKDIGGYSSVKEKIKKEILNLLERKEAMKDPEEIKRLELLIPKGMIFWGPPGTGKTLFAKGIATALHATVTIVSGPELKSKWVGESEERIRRVFLEARRNAPSVIVFDELDSFAVARGTYTGSGVEHSMVNQLLTELDGFRSNEMVFVIGTTNFVESLDPALLRPGRFEFHLCLPYPNEKDRKEIISIYNQKMNLCMEDTAIDYATQRTAGRVEGLGTYHSGDHLQAFCRALARKRLRNNTKENTTVSDVESILTENLELPDLSPEERLTVATHEAGHAICAMNCKHAPEVKRISIRGDIGGSLGYVEHKYSKTRYVYTKEMLLDEICVLLGGRCAEELLLQDLSIGSSHDLRVATNISESLCKELGFYGPLRTFVDEKYKDVPMSNETKILLEKQIQQVLDNAKLRAKDILAVHKKELTALRDTLLEKGVLDCTDVNQLLEKN